MVCGAAFFPSLICGTMFLINFVAIYYHASRAIPFLTMVLALHGVYAVLNNLFHKYCEGYMYIQV